jgi:hypothetical protein
MCASAASSAWRTSIASCFLLASVLSVNSAPVMAVPPTLKGLDTKRFCPASGGSVNKNLLARAIIDAYKLPQSMVDWNNTGTIGYEENARAVSTYLCGYPNPTTLEQISMCYVLDPKTKKPVIGPGGVAKPTADASTQGRLVVELELALSNSQRDNPDGQGGFNLDLDKSTLHFIRRRPPATNLESRQKALLANPGSRPLVAEVFSADYFDITCTTKSTPPSIPGVGVPPSTSPPVGSGSISAAGSVPSNFLEHFRLRGKVDELNITRDSGAFAGVTPATLAVVNDNIAQKNTFDLHVVLGYALPTLQLGAGDTVLESIPFVEYDRDYVDGGKAPPNSTNVDNLIAGVQESLTFPMAETFYANVIVQPQYIWALRTGAEIAKLHLAFQPEPLLPYFGFAAPTVVPGFSATAYVRPVLNAGEVVRPTTDATLAKTNNFVQGGIQLGTSVFCEDETSIFNGLSIPIAYTNLDGFSGQYRSIQLFSAAINYTVPKTKYITVGLSYTTGRNVDTFEQQQVYKASLGAKF